jgi:hypothetical protein
MIGLIATLGLAIAFITVVVAQFIWRGWIQGARALMRGEGLLAPFAPAPELAPLANERRGRLRDLEDEYRRSQGPEAEWTAERLRALLRTQLSGDQVIVVSNREPYIHERGEGGIVVKLVTSLHDGMNLVCKEFVAARDDLAGVLVLSRFAGDDVNDEPVFARAPTHWLTLRVGRDAASRARFFLDSPAEMAMLLERLRNRLDEAGTGRRL